MIVSKGDPASQLLPGWQEFELGRVAQLRLGRTPFRASPQYWVKDGVPWVSIADLNFGTVLKTKEAISDRAVNEVFRGSISPVGTLLLSFKLTIGKVGILGMPAAHNEAIVSVFPDAKYADRDFLFYLFQETDLAASEDTYVKGKTLNKQKLQSLEVVLPTVLEQRAIAAVLRTVQRTLEASECVIITVRRLRKSLADYLLESDASTLPDRVDDPDGSPNSVQCAMRWKSTSLGQVVGPISTHVLPINTPNLPYVGLEHLRTGDTQLRHWGIPAETISTKTLFDRGDILYGKLRPYLDKAVIAPFAGICSTDILVLRPRTHEVDPGVITSILHRPQFVEYAISTATGVNHPRTSWQAIAKYCLALPSLCQQQRISMMLGAVDRKLAAEESRYASLEVLFKSLLRDLLTGRVRLPEFKDGRQ